MWVDGTISLAQSYIAGKVADTVLHAALEAEGPGAALPSRGIAVLGNIEDDFHALGRKMVASFLRLDGWEVMDLGNDVSPSAFVDAAVDGGARIIGVSAMMLSTALNIRGVREELDRRNLSDRIPLAVGGAVFNMRPGLVEEVGGDGTASSAMDAPALFRSLCTKAGEEILRGMVGTRA
ncbi:MAG: corrinoid-binding protein [Treponema sp.]|nr:corrinoid-binding protein [Treponema sp.]